MRQQAQHYRNNLLTSTFPMATPWLANGPVTFVTYLGALPGSMLPTTGCEFVLRKGVGVRPQALLVPALCCLTVSASCSKAIAPALDLHPVHGLDRWRVCRASGSPLWPISEASHFSSTLPRPNSLSEAGAEPALLQNLRSQSLRTQKAGGAHPCPDSLLHAGELIQRKDIGKPNLSCRS